jgi:hypothetical protein
MTTNQLTFSSFYDSLSECKSQIASFTVYSESFTIRWQYMEQEGRDLNVYYQDRPISFSEYEIIQKEMCKVFPAHICEVLDEQIEL